MQARARDRAQKETTMKNKHMLIPLVLVIAGALLIRILLNPNQQKDEQTCTHSATANHERPFFSLGSLISSWVQNLSQNKTVPIEKINFIKDVVLEKEVACIDEDVEVFVEASNPGGAEANLHYQVGSSPGNPAIVSFSESGEQLITVMVKDFTGAAIDTRQVPIKVIACEDRPRVSFLAEYSGENQEIMNFEITERQGMTDNCRYTWDFGDGTAATTKKPFLSHDYRDRKRDRYISSFVVTVTARDDNGNTANTRQTVSLPNVHYISNRMGRALLPVKYDRFPAISRSSCSADVVLYNIFEEDVEFTGATVRFSGCNPAGRAIEEQAAVSNLLKRSRIPAQGTHKDTITLSRAMIPASTCHVGIELRGLLGNEKTVTTNIYLDIPPSKENRAASDNHRRITEKALIGRLDQAQKILGKERPITPGDLERLEKEGRL
jgi:hypothetical protein